MTTAVSPKGLASSVGASLLFALMPLYLQWLPSSSGYVAAGQRIIWTSLFIACVLLFNKQLLNSLKPLTVLSNWPGLICGSLLVGMQWFVFSWAPLNNETLGVSLGYFLLPLTLVLVGRVLYDERLNLAQSLATVFASLAIAYNLWYTGSFSWVALVIALGYPLYFILRRKQSLPVMSAFFIENLLLLPIAWWASQHYGQVAHPFAYSWQELAVFLGLGILGSLGMLCMLYASRLLPVALFGLLGYLEPPLIMLVGIGFLNESIHPGEYLTYILILLALITPSLSGVKHLVRERRRYKQYK